MRRPTAARTITAICAISRAIAEMHASAAAVRIVGGGAAESRGRTSGTLAVTRAQTSGRIVPTKAVVVVQLAVSVTVVSPRAEEAAAGKFRQFRCPYNGPS